MTICSNSGDRYSLFDPMTAKDYDLNYQVKGLFHGDTKLVVLFSKCGWVLITEGADSVIALNPFAKSAFDLPPMELPMFHGVSFSSPPPSPDSTVLMFCKHRHGSEVKVLVWRAGDDDWTHLDFELGPGTEFKLTYSNPVFFDGRFYCLGSRGNLAVFDPSDSEWRVLDKPECVYDDDDLRTMDSRGHLAEFRGELVAFFVPQHEAPVEMFRLDRSEMAWAKMERLEDATMFVDNWSAVIVPQPEGSLCNRVYLPKFGWSEDGDGDKVSAYYDLVNRQYYPKFYGLMEPMNSIWVEPKASRA
ncbi:hypothetical protein C2845_PM09G02990 [Panicum miliaceum]|uniref:KIB1-4 beta-propeller domain-containing protein n=1 Tax=Panicum miliaceum TaxID=4540 RepID=A0A3L6RYV9_PANMI|nr:hypothetical protein C2845_PM09G02990 [Panicum miliaceum]